MAGLIPSNDSASVIPEAQQKRALRIVNDLNKHVKIMRRFDARVNTLHLFTGGVDYSGRPHDQSRVLWADHPQIQLLLERRDRYQGLCRDIETYRRAIDEAEESIPKMKAIESITRLEAQRHRELEAMESCMVNVRKELGVHLNACQKFVTDMAKYCQAERLLQRKLGVNMDDMPDEMIDAQLADGD